MNLKLTGFIFVLCFAFGAGFYLVNETNAQGKAYKIGDRGPGGGFVFYDKGNSDGGWRYLEAAPEDQGEAKWGCPIYWWDSNAKPDNSNGIAIGTAIGTGKANTTAIIRSCEDPGIAAKVAASYRGGGKSDWFLPSKDELNLIYFNLPFIVLKNASSFTTSVYWSSSDINAAQAWCQAFGHGNQECEGKNSSLGVYAIRAF